MSPCNARAGGGSEFFCCTFWDGEFGHFLIAFSDDIIPALNLTNAEFGLLTGIIFTLIYTISGIFVGSLADRFNRSRIIGCGVIIWSFFTALSGLAKNFVQLAIP